jgi:hypothetical protein
MDSTQPPPLFELTAELKQCQTKIKELTKERDEAQKLVDEMREHTEDHDRLIDQWIEVFEMQKGESGKWIFDPGYLQWWDEDTRLHGEYMKLIKDWNKFVTRYNATVNPKPIGRPLAASEAQQKDVLKRRKAGASLRALAEATSLSVRTVRSILAQKKRTNKLRRIEFDRQRAAAYRARLRGRNALPQQITEHLKAGAELIKAAKGIGR